MKAYEREDTIKLAQSVRLPYSTYVLNLLWKAFSDSRDAGWLGVNDELINEFITWLPQEEHELMDELYGGENE